MFPMRWRDVLVLLVLLGSSAVVHWADGPHGARAAGPGETKGTIVPAHAALPAAVAQMRDALIAAAQSGDITELQIVLDWNELKPDVAETKPDDIVAFWKDLSGDGEGREILAALLNVIEGPPAIVRGGRDAENNQLFVWPRFAQTPPESWSPADIVGVLRLASAQKLAQMQARKRYLGWRLAIGADGTWHSFRVAE